jgi:hypothetical protein
VKALKCTLTPNRSDRRRYARWITYRREGDVVVPFGHKREGTESALVALEFSQISATRCGAEFEADWREHLARQPSEPKGRVALSSPYRAARIAAGHIRPRDAVRWSRSLKSVRGDA